ncbi:MAG: outer membrane lipoprotein-sorting protein, partial [Nitrospinaceae bacterium]|nr:outer membrane lipoprotein-sorting protein [Nitrospinaceae bacterium]NIR57216.1 outer membrane lipoprotein-sorting protein [Nitrospinaceae bacterium]NIS87660.1 outer membrane lipoprotein-sorting protein [Nitrospinaceae bacterium]NIT84526.1 outer membrane lipoprotein-sorting protein [Nitrospinaceae bacterium]NIU46716.1 outer membrane lipoprotein-sorting protein [Nitrospinaceae bacterium]
MKTTITCLILSGLLMGASLPAGLTPEEKGRWIALEMEDRIFDHYGDSSFETTLIITDDDGDVYRRHMRSKILEVPGEGDKLLGIFDSPADIKGFATLTVTHKYEPDDLWIYLPEIRRVKRGTSQNKGGDFMGSEWQMEDMARQEPEKFTYRWLREEEMDGMVCHVIERY